MLPLSKLDKGQFRVVCAIELISSQMEIFSCSGDDLITKTIPCLLTYLLFYEIHKIIRYFSLLPYIDGHYITLVETAENIILRLIGLTCMQTY